MKIGLIDVDGHNFPNLALMKISAYHKSKGDEVEWCNPIEHYDKVYMSKVFTFTPDVDVCVNADDVECGGTGYKEYTKVLPESVERIFPDYSIYPRYDFAIGFLTRGCIRKCPWCIVPTKEGYIRKHDSFENIKRSDSRKIVFMDNNVLACEWGLDQIDKLGSTNLLVDFNQALDARLITRDVAKLLGKISWHPYLRLACDTKEMIPIIEQAHAYLVESGVPKSKFFAYALIQDVDEAHRRIEKLRDIGVEPFGQPYRDFNGGEPTDEQRRLARWCNHKAIFKSTKWEDYCENRTVENPDQLRLDDGQEVCVGNCRQGSRDRADNGVEA